MKSPNHPKCQCGCKWINPFMHLQLLVSILLLAPIITPVSAAIDQNGDGLDDIWQEAFGAQGLDKDKDTDGDGASNLAESIAGTDPFGSTSVFSINNLSYDESFSSVDISFDTQRGKIYRIELGNSIKPDQFTRLPTTYHGTGRQITVKLSGDSAPQATNGILHEVWSDIKTSNIAGFKILTQNFTTQPDGIEALPEFQTPKNVDDNYGARMRGWLTPTMSGPHTFYLCSRNHSELFLSSDHTPGNAPTRVAWVNSDILHPGQWQRFPSQQYTADLVAGRRYYIELRHHHGTHSDHCALAWKQPGNNQDASIEIIKGSYLSPWMEGEPITRQIRKTTQQFLKVTVSDLDQDGDSITDWAEKMMEGEHNFFFANSVSTASNLNDLDTALQALSGTRQEVSLLPTDVVAYEDARDSTAINAGVALTSSEPDIIRLTVMRTGSLQPLTVKYTLGTTGQQSTSATSGVDFTQKDINDNPLSGFLSLPFGAVATEIILTPLA
ncbi:MAG: hypothetical protein GY899_17655, partial [Verrucomicrobiaceae bacterium]|nr:hypothetical protein [Verrucomicrobiaceae bacterium]